MDPVTLKVVEEKKFDSETRTTHDDLKKHIDEQARKANAKKEFQRPTGHDDMVLSGLQQKQQEYTAGEGLTLQDIVNSQAAAAQIGGGDPEHWAHAVLRVFRASVVAAHRALRAPRVKERDTHSRKVWQRRSDTQRRQRRKRRQR